MNQTITDQLGGLQHIVTGDIQQGDMTTFLRKGERVIEPADRLLVGLPVGLASFIYDLSVYRKIPVAHQGDIDHGQQAHATERVEIAPGINVTVPKELYPKNIFFIPQEDAARKDAPMFEGLLGYFPAALFEVATHSKVSNEKHNPGEPLHWARGKSNDHADCIVRHLVDAGHPGTPDRKIHLRALAWRALALLQTELESQGAAPGVNSK